MSQRRAVQSTVTTTGGGSRYARRQHADPANAGGLSFSSVVAATRCRALLRGIGGVNTVVNTTRSYIQGSTITAAGPLALSAASKATIWALSIAGIRGRGISKDETGFALAGAGAGAINVVANTIEAYIANDGLQHGNVTLTAAV